jgi:hypothetical protein
MAQRMLAWCGTGERGGKQFAAETRHRAPFSTLSSRYSPQIAKRTGLPDDAGVN